MAVAWAAVLLLLRLLLPLLLLRLLLPLPSLPAVPGLALPPGGWRRCAWLQDSPQEVLHG